MSNKLTDLLGILRARGVLYLKTGEDGGERIMVRRNAAGIEAGLAWLREHKADALAVLRTQTPEETTAAGPMSAGPMSESEIRQVFARLEILYPSRRQVEAERNARYQAEHPRRPIYQTDAEGVSAEEKAKFNRLLAELENAQPIRAMIRF